MSPINEHNLIPAEAYFPELGQAIYSETTLPDGTLEIAFRKQVTTKGRPGRGPA